MNEGEEAQFRVRAVNEAGDGEPTRPTKVLKAENQPEGPKIDASGAGLKDIVLKAGQTLNLALPFTGFPAPEAIWKREDDQLKPDDRTTIETLEDHAQLVVTKVRLRCLLVLFIGQRAKNMAALVFAVSLPSVGWSSSHELVSS